MSMSLFVILALESEPVTNDLNKASKELGYNIEYSDNIELKEQSGFLPVVLNSEKTGVEIYSYPDSDLPEALNNVTDISFSKPVVYQLSFGENPMEGATAFTTAAILCETYDCVAIEGEGGRVLTLEQLKQGAEMFQE
ncbi:hypothetical protein [Microbulbifer sp. 2205BS26-8]|uniref:hypothetical protein n=1 Tax=Microbulbifer sp. 2205BS26-8 TaxID=3064386 RepID=UPI00273F8E57|nr:hypothetical protein [Microbulbifer sp. 2205BS26-8]MDP5210105.1 hypothetical protein [Microbulbifer sp. 2205BS26-8]